MRRSLLALLFLGALPAQAKTLTVAVIDTGIDKNLSHLCKMGHKSFTEVIDPLVDEEGHGTHIAGLINRNAEGGDYCLVSIKYWSQNQTGNQNLRSELAAFRYAINIRVDFINFSGGGVESSKREDLLIKEALNKGIKVVVAAGNESHNLDEECDYHPACSDPRVIMVGNIQLDGGRCASSNYGNIVTRWEVGTDVESDAPNGKKSIRTGTSQACAVATGKLVKAQLAK
jgi:subtilisin family serine protease